MAQLTEINGNLFNDINVRGLAIPKVHIVQCISADYATGKGFAAEVESRYNIRTALKIYGTGIYPDCLVCQNIINMVTKSVKNSKPTFETFIRALELVQLYCQQNNISQLIMPRIGSGLDRLNWEDCKRIITTNLISTGIDVTVYNL